MGFASIRIDSCFYCVVQNAAIKSKVPKHQKVNLWDNEELKIQKKERWFPVPKGVSVIKSVPISFHKICIYQFPWCYFWYTNHYCYNFTIIINYLEREEFKFHRQVDFSLFKYWSFQNKSNAKKEEE